MSEQTQGHWHLDKRLNVGHLLTTMALFVAAMLAFSNLSTRVAVIESDTGRMETDIRERLKRVEAKLDKVIEGQLNRAHEGRP